MTKVLRIQSNMMVITHKQKKPRFREAFLSYPGRDLNLPAAGRPVQLLPAK